MRAPPTDAECYAAVLSVLDGMRVALDPGASKALSFLLQEPEGADAEIGPGGFGVRLGPGPRRHSYAMRWAPGVVSFLLGGDELPPSRTLERRIGPAAVPAVLPAAVAVAAAVPVVGRDLPYGAWHFEERHVRIEELAGRVEVLVRCTDTELAAPLPDMRPESAMRFTAATRPCPRCGGRPDRFRVLGDGAHVCPLCGGSSPAP